MWTGFMWLRIGSRWTFRLHKRQGTYSPDEWLLDLEQNCAPCSARKVKLSLGSAKHHYMKTYAGKWGTAPRIRNISFTAREKGPGTHGPQNWSLHCGEEKHVSPCREWRSVATRPSVSLMTQVPGFASLRITESIRREVYMLSSDTSRPILNAVSHEEHTQIFNRKPPPLYTVVYETLVFQCGNSFPAFLGKFVYFSESREKSVEKSEKVLQFSCENWRAGDADMSNRDRSMEGRSGHDPLTQCCL
jgi:hypothetical protein